MSDFIAERFTEICSTVDELREALAASQRECEYRRVTIGDCDAWADRLEKLSAASVQVTDEMVERGSMAYSEFHMRNGADAQHYVRKQVRNILAAALSPQGEDHGR